ncbi:MAG TPA: ABC transporter permease [Polyangia bacterium]|nr:ABC transporter permease [Polyangia bacterium]
MAESSALYRLTLARVRESVREPGVLFWVFGFPILLSVGLGLAFRGRGPEPVVVGLLDGPGAAVVENALGKAGIKVKHVDEASARKSLRAGKVALVIAPGATADAPLTYRYDPTPAEARLARVAVDEAIQRAAGRRDPRAVRDAPVTEPGSRYIDFLVPGLIGMNLMSGSMWGIGWVIVNMRVRKLLKRLLATPMRRRDLLLAQAIARLGSVPLEVGSMLLFARLAFGVRVAGSWPALAVVAVVGALAFAGLAILVASRARNTETVSGLMNAVMMPMFVLSGVFFSAAHFPAVLQPALGLLPLTALNDGLRAIMVDGASFGVVARPLVVLAAWGAGSFALGLRVFRWG